MKLILVRHGESEWNRELRIQGQTNSELTGTGIMQARAVANVLAKEPLHAIYSSDLTRAIATAEIIAAPHGLNLQLDPRLREMSFGGLEGLTWQEVRDDHPDVKTALQTGAHDFKMPGGGESRDDLVARALAAMDDIAVRYPDQTICVVSHGGLISWFTRHVLGIPRSVPSRLRPDNCAIHRFELYEIGWHLRTFNERAHLPEVFAPDPLAT